MPSIDFDRVKDLVRMDDVLRIIGWRHVRREPTGLRGPCPIHRSSNPRSRSFAASEKGFCCFGCNQRGDQLRLYALVIGQPIYPATVQLCAVLGVPVPYLPSHPPRNGEEER